MVIVPIHQDTSSVPLMTTLVIDLTVSQPVSITAQAPLPTSTAMVIAITTTTSLLPPPTQPQQGSSDSILIQRIGEIEQHMADLLQDNLALEERLDKHGSRLYKLENLDFPYQVSKAVDEIVTDAVDWAIQAPLRDRFRDLLEADMKEILHHRMWETKSYEAHEDHRKLYEALEKSMDRDHSEQLLTNLAKARRKKKRRHESPKTPPGSPPHQPLPPLPPAGPSRTSGASTAPSSSKTTTLAEYMAWMTTDTRIKLSVSSIPEDLHMDADLALDEQVHSSNDEDIGNAHIPNVNLKQDWWKPLSEEDRIVTPEPSWSIPSSDLPVLMNNWASALASTYAPLPENSLLAQPVTWQSLWTDSYQNGRMPLMSSSDSSGDAIIRALHVSKTATLGGKPGKLNSSLLLLNKDLRVSKYGRTGCVLKKNASMTLRLCMVFLTGGSKDNDSTFTNTLLWGDRGAWVSNSLVHSLRAWSTLRRFGLRTASTTAKPCQGDSLEFYLITGILTVAAAGKRHINS
ncbi:hypothetical protein Tco_0085734 [Tanacetum coccineum]